MYPHIPHLRRGCLNSLPEKSAKLSNYVLEIGTSIFLFVIKNRGFFLANIKIPTRYSKVPNKRTGPNKHTGWIIEKQTINVWVQIKVLVGKNPLITL